LTASRRESQVALFLTDSAGSPSRSPVGGKRERREAVSPGIFSFREPRRITPTHWSLAGISGSFLILGKPFPRSPRS
jgi:hypothetical protein